MKTFNPLLLEALENEAAHVRSNIQHEYNSWLGYHKYNVKVCLEDLAPLERRASKISNKLHKVSVKLKTKKKQPLILRNQVKSLQKSLDKVQPLIDIKKKDINFSKAFTPERDLRSSKHNSLKLKLARLEDAIKLARKGKLEPHHARNIQDLIDNYSY